MKNAYLLMTIVGYAIPNYLVAVESIDTGNVLLWLDPQSTVNGMFANRIASAFTADLLLVVLAALCWMLVDGKKMGMKILWIYPVLTLLFGLAGTLPLFLYRRETLRSVRVQDK